MPSSLLHVRLRQVLANHGGGSEDNEAATVVAFAFMHDIHPEIQQGPQCGIVSLKMAEVLVSSSSGPVATTDIFDTAKRLDFTRQGEMFSAEWLGNLATQVYDCRAEVVDSRFLAALSLVELVLQRNAVLIPYDCDKNFEPCERAGNSAHWALVFGFVIVSAVADGGHCDLNDLAASDTDMPNLYWISDVQAASDWLISRQIRCDDPRLLYVLALHGKSRHPGVWSLQTLLKSNQNLFVYNRARVAEDAFRLPAGGVEEGLCNKILVLSRK